VTSAFLDRSEFQRLIPVIVETLQTSFPAFQGLYLFGSSVSGQNNAEIEHRLGDIQTFSSIILTLDH
jgi:hypothetical protein